MTKQIFKSVFLVALSVLSITVIIVFWITYKHFDGRLQEELSREAGYAAAGVELDGIEYLERLRSGVTRVTWIAQDGRVLFDNKANPEEMENHLDREEIKEALATGTGTASRYSPTLSERTIYYALKLEDGSVIRVSGTQYPLWVLLFDMLQPVLIILTSALIIAAILASRLSKKVMKPINEIDFGRPESAEIYEELKPVVQRLAEQNRAIARQMEELKVKQTEFDAITTNMSEGMVIIDNRAEILSCNQSALNMLGVAEVPKSVLQLNRTDSFREAIRTSLAGKKCFYTIRTDEYYYSLHASPVLHDESVEGAVIVILDETEKDDREKLRREFTSNISHELKTPLTSISGFAELIRNGMAGTDDTNHFADNIYKEAQRLIVLVNDIIRLSQLDDGEIPYDETKIDVYEIAKDVVERLENIASAEKITLELTGEHAMVYGNSLILEEMIYNLCDNSIKYNRRGGYVKISISSESEHVSVLVKDNGIGIPKACQSRVFERFYRVDKSHSKEIGGTGLGLSIVKHAAAYHKARISLESKLGEGTEITLTF
ncbi:MAG: ATP-binding protein [Eubacteriales bacterium]|nr:ATP-binding protein [Eubacteriales bacterium]